MSKPKPIWEQPDFDPRDLEFSKTEQKKAMDRLQQLGDRLGQLPLAQIQQLPVSELMQDTLAELVSIKSHEARRRQSQRISKCLRDEDEAALMNHLFATLPPKRQAQADRWIERLIEHGLSEVGDFARQYRPADRYTLGLLIDRYGYRVASTGIADATELQNYVRYVAFFVDS